MKKFKGIFFLIFASVVFGFLPLFSKTAFDNGFNLYTFILARSFFGALIFYVYLKLKKISFKLSPKEFKEILKVSILGHGLMLLTLIGSYNYIPTGIATAVHFLYPVIIMIGAVKYYGQVIDFKKLLLILTSIVGIIFIIGLKGNSNISAIGLILALLSAVSYAYYVLELGKGASKYFNPFKLVFYVILFNAALFLILTIGLNKMSLNITAVGWYNMMLASIFLVLAMIAVKKGLEDIDVVTAGILGTFEPMTSLIVGVVFLQELLKIQHLLGSTLIIASAVFATVLEQTKSIKNKEYPDLIKNKKYKKI